MEVSPTAGFEAIALFSSDNNSSLLIAGAGDGGVTIYDKDLKATARLLLPAAVVSLSLAPGDQKEVLAGLADGSIFRLRSDLSKSLLLSENHASCVVAVSYPPGVSDTFATASLDRTLRIWDANEYSCKSTAKIKDAGDPACLVFTLDFLVSGWTDGQIRAHADAKLLWSLENAHRNGVSALLVSKNTRFIVSGGNDGDVRVWDIATRRLVSHLKEHRSRVSCLALYDDNLRCLSCSRDKSFLSWDLQKEKRTTSHAQRMGAINSIALAKDQTSVYTVGQEKRLTKWDLRRPHFQDQADLDRENSQSDEANCVALSHSGQIVATGGTQKTLKLWKTTCDVFATLQCHSAPITDLKFSPDDKQLVTVGQDGLIFVMNLFC